MARILRDGLWFCDDCTMAHAGIDETIVDQGRAKAVEKGQIRLNAIGHVVSDDPDGSWRYEFSHWQCDCCGTLISGQRTRHAILGD